jgi:hypothetical protein
MLLVDSRDVEDPTVEEGSNVDWDELVGSEEEIPTELEGTDEDIEVMSSLMDKTLDSELANEELETRVLIEPVVVETPLLAWELLDSTLLKVDEASVLETVLDNSKLLDGLVDRLVEEATSDVLVVISKVTVELESSVLDGTTVAELNDDSEVRIDELEVSVLLGMKLLREEDANEENAEAERLETSLVVWTELDSDSDSEEADEEGEAVDISVLLETVLKAEEEISDETSLLESVEVGALKLDDKTTLEESMTEADVVVELSKLKVSVTDDVAELDPLETKDEAMDVTLTVSMELEGSRTLDEKPEVVTNTVELIDGTPEEMLDVSDVVLAMKLLETLSDVDWTMLEDRDDSTLVEEAVKETDPTSDVDDRSALLDSVDETRPLEDSMEELIVLVDWMTEDEADSGSSL